MRHRKSGRKIVVRSHQKALLRNLSIALLERHVIRTTLARAKEMRRFLEPLISKASKTTADNNVANQRFVFSKLRNKESVKALFNDLTSIYKTRDGGYLRILKSGYRNGDKAPMAVVVLVDTEKDFRSPVANAPVKKEVQEEKKESKKTEK